MSSQSRDAILCATRHLSGARNARSLKSALYLLYETNNLDQQDLE